MSAEQTPDIETVLAEHTYMLQMSKGAICLCGFVPTVDPDSLATQQDYHRAHVAQALAPVLAAVVREAEQRALQEAADAAVSDTDDCVPWDHDHDRATVACWLEDRADRVAEPQPGSLEYAQMVADQYGDLNDETEEETR